uniref:PID domain-containing protein n=1 Tax=Plectus sambesii TaxID=2011161 RepID=A0A914V3V4_9BILA
MKKAVCEGDGPTAATVRYDPSLSAPELVEQFPMELVADPTAHLSTDPRDVYNNILLFVVREDRRNGQRSTTPTEMHIFQCNRVSANEVVDDFRAFLAGQFQRVRTGRRDTGFVVAAPPPSFNNGFVREAAPVRQGDRAAFRDDASASSDASEYFERDVNTLNRCFDDIERFVARIQSAALAQRELESQQHRYRTAQRPRRDNHTGILQLRAQLPGELEFVDILQKFKLSFNLLAKLKNHIHEPNAPELLHFLFTPLTVILDACQWGLGRNIAPQIVSPLLARETKELMQNCLTSKESDVWMALGDTWRIPPEDWPGPLPQPYRPVFADGFMPYGPPVGLEVPGRQQQPIYQQQQAPPVQPAAAHRGRSVDNPAEGVECDNAFPRAQQLLNRFTVPHDCFSDANALGDEQSSASRINQPYSCCMGRRRWDNDRSALSLVQSSARAQTFSSTPPSPLCPRAIASRRIKSPPPNSHIFLCLTRRIGESAPRLFGLAASLTDQWPARPLAGRFDRPAILECPSSTARLPTPLLPPRPVTHSLTPFAPPHFKGESLLILCARHATRCSVPRSSLAVIN